MKSLKEVQTFPSYGLNGMEDSTTRSVSASLPIKDSILRTELAASTVDSDGPRMIRLVIDSMDIA